MNKNYYIHNQKLNYYKGMINKFFGIEDVCGIYLIYRVDENGQKIGYVGQSINVLTRLAEHMLGYKQAIDKSIMKHKIMCQENSTRFSYKMKVLKVCDKSLLDFYEKEYVRALLQKGIILKNITSGGQNGERTDINYRKAAKGYHDGLKQGYNNCLNDMRVFFSKYLDFKIKDSQKRKDGTFNKLGIQKEAELKELLFGKDNGME